MKEFYNQLKCVAPFINNYYANSIAAQIVENLSSSEKSVFTYWGFTEMNIVKSFEEKKYYFGLLDIHIQIEKYLIFKGIRGFMNSNRIIYGQIIEIDEKVELKQVTDMHFHNLLAKPEEFAFLRENIQVYLNEYPHLKVWQGRTGKNNSRVISLFVSQKNTNWSTYGNLVLSIDFGEKDLSCSIGFYRKKSKSKNYTMDELNLEVQNYFRGLGIKYDGPNGIRSNKKWFLFPEFRRVIINEEQIKHNNFDNIVQLINEISEKIDN